MSSIAITPSAQKRYATAMAVVLSIGAVTRYQSPAVADAFVSTVQPQAYQEQQRNGVSEPTIQSGRIIAIDHEQKTSVCKWESYERTYRAVSKTAYRKKGKTASWS